jgi:hypothetical protein
VRARVELACGEDRQDGGVVAVEGDDDLAGSAELGAAQDVTTGPVALDGGVAGQVTRRAPSAG